MIYPKQFRIYLTIFLSAAFCVSSASVLAQTAEEYHEKGMAEYNEINYGAAMSNFRKAADMGHAPSQTMLGTLLDAAEYNEEARDWFKRAADQGNTDSQLGLARMLAIGDGGEIDFPGALKLYTAAAEQGSLEAMRVLETNYRKGGFGVEADSERADFWLEKAAAGGDRWSKEQLAARRASDEDS